jgi:integrase
VNLSFQPPEEDDPRDDDQREHATAPQAPSGQQAEPTNEQAAHDEWWDSKNMSSEFSLMTMNQSRSAWHERARRAALAGHQSERPAPAGQAVGALRYALSLMFTYFRADENELNRNVFDAARDALADLLRPDDMNPVTAAREYEADPFTAAERDAIIAAARADERPMILFWFNAGLRPGEMIALKWAKIDLTRARARIDLNQVAGVEKAPKTAAGIRDLELNAEAIEALRAQAAISKAKGEHVWLNPASGQPWTTDAQIRKTLWVPLLKRSGVRYRNPYQARHTYASAALTDGANPWYLADQLGHEDATMVFTTYGKFIGEDYKKPKAALKAVA